MFNKYVTDTNIDIIENGKALFYNRIRWKNTIILRKLIGIIIKPN